MKLAILALAAVALTAAATPPNDRPYVMATTTHPVAEVAGCVHGVFASMGAADVTPTDYGQRIDYRYKNLGGAVKTPTMSFEVHNDGTLILYGFKSYKGAAKSGWKQLAKKCFPELADAPLVKP